MTEFKNWEEVSLEAICRGDAINQIDHQLRRVVENIRDPNTDAQAARKITLTVTFRPDANRSGAEITFKVETKFAGDMPGSDRIVISPSSGIGYVSSMEQLDLSSMEPRLIPKGNGGDV